MKFMALSFATYWGFALMKSGGAVRKDEGVGRWTMVPVVCFQSVGMVFWNSYMVIVKPTVEG